jgi:hypothetical protein
MIDIARDLTRQVAEVLGWWRQHGHAAVVVFDRMRVPVHHESAEQAAIVISEDAPVPAPDEVTPRLPGQARGAGW